MSRQGDCKTDRHICLLLFNRKEWKQVGVLVTRPYLKVETLYLTCKWVDTDLSYFKALGHHEAKDNLARM